MRKKRQLHLPLLFLAVLFGLFLSLGSQSRAYETKNLTLNGSYDGNETYMQVGDVEYWKFTVPSDGHVALKANFECNAFVWALYNEDLSEKFFEENSFTASPTSPETKSWDSYLSKGTYVIKIRNIEEFSRKIPGWVRLCGSFQSAQVTDGEPNNKFMYATFICAGDDGRLKGALTRTDDVDFYWFHVPKTGQVSIKLNTGIHFQNFVLYNSDREQIFKEGVWNGTEASPQLFEYSEALEAGNYYIKIEKGDWDSTINVGTYYLTYNTSSVSSVKLSKSSLTLSRGKTAKLTATVQPDNAVNREVSWSSSDSDVVSVEEDGSLYAGTPGIAVITARSTDGTNLSSSCTVKVVPVKISDVYVKSQTRNTVTLRWDSVFGADGYRVYKYNAKKKKFDIYRDTANTEIQVSKLSPETRYVFKIAGYKKSGKTKLVGTASAKKVAYTAPKLLKVPKITSKKILSRSYHRVNLSLNWKPVSGATGYKVYYRHSPAVKWNLLTNRKTCGVKGTFYVNGICYIRVTPYRTRNRVTTEGASKILVIRE